jgi:hypothetical protein
VPRITLEGEHANDLLIEGRAGFPTDVVLCFVIAVASVTVAFVIENRDPALFAAFPAGFGVALLSVRQRPFSARLTRDILQVDQPPLSLAYKAINTVVLCGKPGQARAPIQLAHAGGVVQFPERLNVRSDELYEYLLGKLRPNTGEHLPKVLAKYCALQQALYGSQRVQCYTPRPILPDNTRWSEIAFCLGSLPAGAVWIGAGILLGKDGGSWIAFGVIAGILGGFCLLALLLVGNAASQTPMIKNWEQSGLVISPGGLALVQGDMQGELRWEEVRKIRYGPVFFTFQKTGRQVLGIDLVVDGATIAIADLYDRPLGMIYQRLREAWQWEE